VRIELAPNLFDLKSQNLRVRRYIGKCSWSEAIVQSWSGERGVGILRAGSRNYCQSFINIEIPLKIEI
jgi:hypothetical protein